MLLRQPRLAIRVVIAAVKQAGRIVFAIPCLGGVLAFTSYCNDFICCTQVTSPLWLPIWNRHRTDGLSMTDPSGCNHREPACSRCLPLPPALQVSCAIRVVGGFDAASMPVVASVVVSGRGLYSK